MFTSPVNENVNFINSKDWIYNFEVLPSEEALLIARDVKEKLNTTMLAVDMLKPENEGNYKMIEASIFIQVDTAEQLIINGVSGYYLYYDGNFNFRHGKYWVQELALNEVLKRWISNAKKRRKPSEKRSLLS